MKIAGICASVVLLILVVFSIYIGTKNKNLLEQMRKEACRPSRVESIIRAFDTEYVMCTDGYIVCPVDGLIVGDVYGIVNNQRL